MSGFSHYRVQGFDLDRPAYRSAEDGSMVSWRNPAWSNNHDLLVDVMEDIHAHVGTCIIHASRCDVSGEDDKTYSALTKDEGIAIRLQDRTQCRALQPKKSSPSTNKPKGHRTSSSGEQAVVMVAKYAGHCRRCRQPFPAGTLIAWNKVSGARHEGCA